MKAYPILKATVACAAAVTLGAASAQVSDDVVKIGVIVDVGGVYSAAAIAMQKLAAEKKKPIIFAGSATTALTNKECSP